jgi:hypothetical protein
MELLVPKCWSILISHRNLIIEEAINRESSESALTYGRAFSGETKLSPSTGEVSA